MSDSIADGKVVEFHYTLTDGDGNVIDSSSGRDPLAYLHGASNIVPGLERQMADKAVGDKFMAVVPPAEGYGERHEGAGQTVPRTAFPDDLDVQVGMTFMARADNGQQVQVWVSGVQGDQVLIDLNHPLAGATLHFDVEVVTIRDATDEEKAHGHPHGPGGHDH